MYTYVWVTIVVTGLRYTSGAGVLDVAVGLTNTNSSHDGVHTTLEQQHSAVKIKVNYPCPPSPPIPARSLPWALPKICTIEVRYMVYL